MPKGKVTRKKLGGKAKSKKATKVKVKKSVAVSGPRSKEIDKKQLIALHKKHDEDWKSIGKALGIAGARARREYYLATMRDGDMIKGSRSKVGKAIVALKGEGLPMPAIRARTGMKPGEVKALYEETTGEPWGGGRGRKPAKSKSKSKAKGKVKAKATSKKSVKKVSSKKVKKSKVKASKVADDEDEGDESPKAEDNGRPTSSKKGSKKKVNLKAMVRKVWDLDTPEKEVAKILEGRVILINRNIDGHRSRTQKVKVMKVTKFSDGKTGKVVLFQDKDQKQRIVNLADISALKPIAVG